MNHTKETNFLLTFTFICLFLLLIFGGILKKDNKTMENTALQQLATEIDNMIENTEKFSKERFHLEVLRKTVMKPFFEIEKQQLALCLEEKLSNSLVYQFLYNPNTCESVAHTVSIHRTKKGAEMAMEFHKAEKQKEWENEQKENEKHGLVKDTYPWHFDQSWGVFETKLKD